MKFSQLEITWKYMGMSVMSAAFVYLSLNLSFVSNKNSVDLNFFRMMSALFIL